MRRFVSWRLEWPRTEYRLAVTPAGTGEMLGTVGIRKESPAAFEAEIGHEVAPSHWSHGYATEATTAMLAFAFTDLQVHRVWVHCIHDDSASAGVLTSAGEAQGSAPGQGRTASG